MQREPELPVVVQAFVAGLQDPAALGFSVAALNPFCGVNHSPAGSGTPGIGIYPHHHRVVRSLDFDHLFQQTIHIGHRNTIDFDIR